MTVRETMDHNRDTTGWGVVGLILGLLTSPDIRDLLAQAVVIILFPSIGWTLLYFIKREITYWFPPKKHKELSDDNSED